MKVVMATVCYRL